MSVRKALSYGFGLVFVALVVATVVVFVTSSDFSLLGVTATSSSPPPRTALTFNPLVPLLLALLLSAALWGTGRLTNREKARSSAPSRSGGDQG